MIKIAQNSYRLANRQKLLTEYLFWCKLKMYNPQGTIKRDNQSILKVADTFQISESTVRRYLTKLTRAGLVNRNKYTYSLISYDRCWEELGVKTKSRGKYVIFKFDNEKNLKESVEFAEINFKTKRQAYQSRRFILKNPKHFSDTEIRNLKNSPFTDIIQILDDMYVKRLSVLKNVKEYFKDKFLSEFNAKAGRKEYRFHKITPFLTCKNISETLGFEPNSRMGQNIRKRIQDCGLVRWETRENHFLNSVDWNNAIEGNKLRSQYPSFIRDNGVGYSLKLISRMVV